MNNVVDFPTQDRIEIWSGVSNATGKTVWIFNMLFDDGIACIGDYHSLEAARVAAQELRQQGNTVIWKGVPR